MKFSPVIGNTTGFKYQSECPITKKPIYFEVLEEVNFNEQRHRN
jgi:hypothetical protein